jgi:hypothetical protein
MIMDDAGESAGTGGVHVRQGVEPIGPFDVDRAWTTG